MICGVPRHDVFMFGSKRIIVDSRGHVLASGTHKSFGQTTKLLVPAIKGGKVDKEKCDRLRKAITEALVRAIKDLRKSRVEAAARGNQKSTTDLAYGYDPFDHYRGSRSMIETDEPDIFVQVDAMELAGYDAPVVRIKPRGESVECEGMGLLGETLKALRANSQGVLDVDNTTVQVEDPEDAAFYRVGARLRTLPKLNAPIEDEEDDDKLDPSKRVKKIMSKSDEHWDARDKDLILKNIFISLSQKHRS